MRHYLRSHPRFAGRLVNAMGLRRRQRVPRAPGRPPGSAATAIPGPAGPGSTGCRSSISPPTTSSASSTMPASRRTGPMPPACRGSVCSFCILASRSDLRRAAELRPDLYRAYTELEQRIGHTLRASPRARPGALRASPVPASPHTGSRTPRRSARCTRSRAPAERARTSLRTASCTGARTSAATAAFAFGSVLRTTACGSRRTVRHSIAVAAPLRRLRRRRFPETWMQQDWPFRTARGGLGSHTRRIVDAVRARLHLRRLLPPQR